MTATLLQQQRYKAKLKLSWVERVASNAAIVKKFTELGFTDVACEGSGGERIVTGKWTGTDQDVKVPSQVVIIEKV